MTTVALSPDGKVACGQGSKPAVFEEYLEEFPDVFSGSLAGSDGHITMAKPSTDGLVNEESMRVCVPRERVQGNGPRVVIDPARTKFLP